MATHSSREAEKVNILRIKEKDSWGKMLCWSPIVSVTVYIELFLVTMSHLFFSSYFFSFTVRSLLLLYHYVGFKILSLSLSFFNILAVPHGMQDLCSPTMDITHAPCSGRVES